MIVGLTSDHFPEELGSLIAGEFGEQTLDARPSFISVGSNLDAFLPQRDGVGFETVLGQNVADPGGVDHFDAVLGLRLADPGPGRFDERGVLAFVGRGH